MRNSLSHEQVEHAASPDAGARTAGTRLAGLDALRGIAMLLGVVLHACIAYSPSSLDGLLWPVHDTAVSRVCEGLFWWIHAFRLPLFFFLAGYFSEHLFQSRPLDVFCRQRAMRILVPYYVALVTILPVNLLVWTLGWVQSGRCTWEQALSPFVEFAPELQTHYFGPAHLWFLMDLSILTLGYTWLRAEWGSGGGTPREVRLPLGPDWCRPFLLAIPSGLFLWDDLSSYSGHHNSFVPHTVRMAYFGFYFLVGVQVCRRAGLLERLAAWPARHALASLPAVVLVLILGPRQATQPVSELEILLLAGAVAWTAWCTLFAALGLALRVRVQHPAMRFSADASYWIYLCHLPLVGLGQILLAPVDLPGLVKMTLVVLFTTGIGLATYQAWVRYTVIGRVLHGERRREAAGTTRGTVRQVPEPHLPRDSRVRAGTGSGVGTGAGTRTR